MKHSLPVTDELRDQHAADFKALQAVVRLRAILVRGRGPSPAEWSALADVGASDALGPQPDPTPCPTQGE